MKKIILLIIIASFINTNVYASEEDKDSNITYELVEKQLDNLNINEITNIIKKINTDTKEYFGDIEFKSIIQRIVKGEKVFEEEKILNGILKLLLDEFMKNIDLILQLLLLAIISAILINLQNSFENETISNIANFIIYIILISIIIKSFVLAIDIGKD
ncbi:stage III sporulation protein AE, partial [Senegalia sp. (in: firmicutes)]